MILLAVGRTDPNLIAKHKRLIGYDNEDFKLLTEFLGGSVKLVTCPNITTEASNLLRQIGSPYREQVTAGLGNVVQTMDEHYVTSGAAVQHPLFVRLGLTDAALTILLESGAELLTVDLDVYVEALNTGFKSTNFNHLREQKLGY